MRNATGTLIVIQKAIGIPQSQGAIADEGKKIAEAQRMCAEGRDEMEIELTVGPEVLRHCHEKGLISRLGGRP